MIPRANGTCETSVTLLNLDSDSVTSICRSPSSSGPSVATIRSYWNNLSFFALMALRRTASVWAGYLARYASSSALSVWLLAYPSLYFKSISSYLRYLSDGLCDCLCSSERHSHTKKSSTNESALTRQAVIFLASSSSPFCLDLYWAPHQFLMSLSASFLLRLCSSRKRSSIVRLMSVNRGFSYYNYIKLEL